MLDCDSYKPLVFRATEITGKKSKSNSGNVQSSYRLLFYEVRASLWIQVNKNSFRANKSSVGKNSNMTCI